MASHGITLWTEDHKLIGHITLVDYPLIGDVVRDVDGHDWLVTGRQWHEEGLVLLVRPSG